MSPVSRIFATMEQEGRAILAAVARFTEEGDSQRDNFLFVLLQSVIQRLCECEGKVIVTGMGKIGYVGHRFAMTLASTGTPAFFLHPGEAQHGDVGMLDARDVLIACSNSGKTREVCETMRQVRAAFPHVPQVAIVGTPATPVAHLATLTLAYGPIAEACPLDLTPTSSLAVASALLDGIALAVMEVKGMTRHDYAQRHHGGYLGEKARQR